MRRSCRPESIGFRRPREGFEPPKTTFGVSAGAGIFNRDLLDTVGPFDEKFVAYFEDADLCFRARIAGYGAGCAGQAIAYHVGSASQEGKTWWRSRQCFRNHALLTMKSMPFILLLKYCPRIIAERFHQAGMLLSSARAEFGLARALVELCKASFEILLLTPHALWERRKLMRKRTINTELLDELFAR